MDWGQTKTRLAHGSQEDAYEIPLGEIFSLALRTVAGFGIWDLGNYNTTTHNHSKLTATPVIMEITIIIVIIFRRIITILTSLIIVLLIALSAI